MNEEPTPLSGRKIAPWHAISPEEALRDLDASLGGLSGEEVSRRLSVHGMNILPARRPPGPLLIFARQFMNPLIYILLVAGIISIFFQDLADASFIFIVILVNAVIGTFQEVKAEQSAAALQEMLKVYARVRRGGGETTVPSDALVPGDIVLLESGNRVPADIRILRSQNLAVDESLLTGESHAVRKSEERSAPDAPVADRTSMLYAGSTVMSGRSTGVVVATGIATEIGRIAETTSASEMGKPPLIIRMEEFSRKISIAVLAAAGLLAAVVLAQGMPPVDVFFLAVALAVAAIPEGLPVAMTVALSIATARMAARNVIVRFLAAVESLGSCTLIASDKTGTLTVNQQTARVVVLPTGERFAVSGAGYDGEGDVTREGGGEAADETLDRLVRASAICNEAQLQRGDGEWTYQGDAIDVAFLALGYKAGIDPVAVRSGVDVVAEVPFESERRYAAVWYRGDGGVRVAVKGALEAVLPRCETMATPDGAVPVDRAGIEAQLALLTGQGYRVIAVATGRSEAFAEEADLPALLLLGLVGFIDPIRPDVPDAIRRCREAGVDVVMVTGDHPATALAIARELDIATSEDEVTTGTDLDAISPPTYPEYVDRVEKTRVFARVTPLQKLHIVEALRGAGAFVAVTGDGVNDAPALRSANIGVAMGSGTDVAKDTASLIITDNDFASIVAGIEEGRYAYDNVRKVTYLLVSAGFAEVLLFLLALVVGLPLPLLAVQLLWLNLVTNGIQGAALAFEKGEPGAMSRPPRRPGEGIFDELMVKETILSGTVIGVVALGTWAWLLANGWEVDAARNLVILLMVLLENFHVFNCRSETRSVFGVPISSNYFLVLGVVAAQGVHIIALYIPFFQEVLGFAPVSLEEWVTLLLLASIVVVVMEIYKFVRRRGGAERRTRAAPA